MSTPTDWRAVRAVIRKDVIAIRRSKAIVLPMLIVPTLLMVVLPLLIGFAAVQQRSPEITRLLEDLPSGLGDPILALPTDEQLVMLVLGFLLAPLFLIVPLMVSSVLAADAFAGEKERRTLETLMHLPISDRDLFLAKVLGSVVPAIAISWLGFLAYALVANTVAWPVMGRVFVPNALWLVVIFWVAPAVATLGMGVMVRVSARARTTQEANQLGGAVVLPLIFLAVGQSTGLLLLDPPVALIIGAVIWTAALGLAWRGARKFTRDRLAATA